MSRAGDSLEKCREARWRRTETHRLAAAGEGTSPRRTPKRLEADKESEALGGGAGKERSRTVDDVDAPPPPPSSSWFSLPTSSSSLSTSPSLGGEPGAAATASSSRSGTAESEPAVVFGSVSLSGRSMEMEDAVSVRPAFFWRQGRPLLHFFAVSDGHGGFHVSALCKEWMHVPLAEELGRAETAAPPSDDGGALLRTDGRYGAVGVRMRELVGSTAVVALVGSGRLVVANCGDSRVVLSRGGRTVPLSEDHKADRVDELARIEAAGGFVMYLNGARVQGMFAVLRGLGDKYLKPFVISKPEIRVGERTDEDECLIVASDGLWDVLSNELACDVARRCLEEAEQSTTQEDEVPGGVGCGDASCEEVEEEGSDALCSLAATLLARLALGRGSCDNISVIVIDLRRNRG